MDRTSPPVINGNISFKLPNEKKLKTANGIEVRFTQKNELPIIHLNILIEAGSKFDPEGKHGLAYLTSLMIDEGAGEYDSIEFNRQMNMLGSSLGISCDHDYFYISLLSLSDKFEKSLELMSLVLKKPKFRVEDFDREKKKLVNILLQAQNDPEDVAHKVFESKVYGTFNKYGNSIPGSIETIQKITLDDVKYYFDSRIIKNNLSVIVTGNIEDINLLKLLNRTFSFINSSESFSGVEYFTKANPTSIFIVDKPDAPQTEIRIGQPVNHRNHPDYYARQLMNLILGGQFSSRLNANLREKRGLTYGVRSFFGYNKKGGYFCVSASVDAEKTYEAVSEIINELHGMQKEISDSELEFAKSSIVKKYPLNFETYGQISSNMITKFIYNLESDYFNTYTERVKNSGADEVLQAARNNLKPDNLVIVLVGNKDVITKELVSFPGISIEHCDAKNL